MTKEWIDKLNPAQRSAVTQIKGPLLVLAGAGTGKTRVITVRVAHMLDKGIDPTNILAVTFTNKAASEMRDRIAELVGKKRAKLLTVGTFHSFCLKALRSHGDELGMPEGFTICDSSDQLSIMKGSLRELHIPEAKIQPGALQSVISLQKNRLVTADEFLEAACDDREELIGRAWKRYEEQLRRARLLDFDDLLLRMRDLLRGEKLRAQYQKRFQYVLVDEFQDTNGPQYEIVHSICEKHQNLCAVGDDDQSIYGWRGADITKILGFEKDYKGAKVVRLETNYRSTGQILAAANRVIQNNPSRHEKELVSAFGDGEPVRVARMEDEIAEADGIVLEILETVRRGQSKLGDYAILFRTAVQPRAFEAQLRARAVPYDLVGGMSFFDRKEIRDVLAYMKLVANPLDEASFLRIVNRPARGIGKVSLDRALAFATQEGISVTRAFERADEIEKLSPAAVDAVRELRKTLTWMGDKNPGTDLVAWLIDLLEVIGYRTEVNKSYAEDKTREDRWQTVKGMYDFAENYVRRSEEPSLEGFLEELLLSNQDDRFKDKDKGERRDVVTLMTLHASKGLEFPIVYLVGCEEGLLPHTRSVAEDGLEEERRLMYVGITRAQKRLTLSWASQRSKYGTRAVSMPSRFLYEAKGEAPPKDWVAVEQMTQERAAPGKKKRKTKRKATRRR